MPNVSMIFDIETILDADLAKRLGYQAKEGTFHPLLFHLPCAIAVGHLTSEGALTHVESLHGILGASDACTLTEAFWELANHTPMLISFNGRGFDLPVLELCALRFGCVAPKHWTEAHGMRYRYGKAHLDLLDILSNYGGATKGLSLSNVVQLLGYAGKGDLTGADVQGLYALGKIEEIEHYNRLDVIRLFAVWLQWARISGRLTPSLYDSALQASKPWLDHIRLDEAAE